MSKWHSLLEYFQFPLKVLFFATFLLGIGSLIANTNLLLVNEADPSALLTISELLKFTGAFLIKLFPLLVFIKMLSKHFEDSAPVLLGMFSFIIIIVIVMILSKSDFPTYFYDNVFGISIERTFVKELNVIATKSAYNMGIFPYIFAYLIVRFSYKRSRHHVRHGLFYFIDHDSWAMLITLVLSIIVAVSLSVVWPFIIEMIDQFFIYIASDINSPLHLFFYGIFERFSAVLNMADIPRNVFWFSEAGGSWIDSLGNTFVGDVPIWEATKDINDANVTAGQFISGYYIINIFIIPAFLIAYYRLMGKKNTRKKYLIFIVLAVIMSIVCGNSLPIELCMLIISPLLYVIYLFIVGFAFAATTSLEAFIGFDFQGNIMAANPGNIIDLLAYINNVDFYRSVIAILSTGAILSVIFYFTTIYYFKKTAIGLLSVHDADSVARQVVDAMGGLENIQEIDATPDKLITSFVSRDIVDLDRLHELGAYLILESRDGYYIRLGNISIMVCDQIHLYKEREKQKGS